MLPLMLSFKSGMARRSSRTAVLFNRNMHKLGAEDTLQLMLEAETKDQREFYQVVGDFLLQKNQREVIERNLF